MPQHHPSDLVVSIPACVVERILALHFQREPSGLMFALPFSFGQIIHSRMISRSASFLSIGTPRYPAGLGDRLNAAFQCFVLPMANQLLQVRST